MASNDEKNHTRKRSWRKRAGTVEAWLALVIAISSWLCAIKPEFAHVKSLKEMDKYFLNDAVPLLVVIVGLCLAAGGARHGNAQARVVGCWALVLLMPAALIYGWLASRWLRYFS